MRSRSAVFARATCIVETKPDRTPVTEADRAVEEAIRERLASERPGDGMLGEEFGVTGGASRRWIVDPIDGTRNYSRGIPVWATLIALEEDGVIRLGVVSALRSGGAGGPSAARARSSTAIRSTSPASPRSRTRCCASRSSSRCRRSLSAAGTRGPTAISGRTCWSPRVPSTARSMRSASSLGSRRPPADRGGGRRALHRPRRQRAGRRPLGGLVERAPARRAARGVDS